MGRGGRRVFDSGDRRGLPPVEVLRRAWELSLPHEDPGLDFERRLLSVAQAVRDWPGPTGPMETTTEEGRP